MDAGRAAAPPVAPAATAPPARRPPAPRIGAETTRGAPEAPEPAAGDDGRESVRSELANRGVIGPMRDRLAAGGVTVTEIRRAWGSISRDASVRDRTAVLVRRLAPSAGIRLDRPASIDPGVARAAALIEARRRDLVRTRTGQLVEVVA